LDDIVKTEAASDSRRLDILRAAAELLAARGYGGTSMRDIAAAVGMLPGSLYYHFPSKDVLIEEIFKTGSELLRAAVEADLAELTDPWVRLERACITHLEAHLSNRGVAQIVTAGGLRSPPELRARLVRHLDHYERLFAELVAALDLPPALDRSIYRLSLLSALNTVDLWYRPGGKTPEAIARQIFAIFDHRAVARRQPASA
jgi:TetR/AcrR family transcriptional regulator, cholesterol catabolism regulator